MRQKATEAPSHWVEELAKADADIARGDVVLASVVHEHLRQALAELEAELAGDPVPPQCPSEP